MEGDKITARQDFLGLLWPNLDIKEEGSSSVMKVVSMVVADKGGVSY